MGLLATELIAGGVVLALGKWIVSGYYVVKGLRLRKMQRTCNEIFDEMEEKSGEKE